MYLNYLNRFRMHISASLRIIDSIDNKIVIVIVTSGLCLQIFIGFQIAKLAPDNKLINAIIYNSILAFAYVLTINLLFEPMGKAQHQLIALIFCLSLGLLIYLSEHRQECDLSFFHKK